MKKSKDLISERLKIINNRIELIQRDYSDRTKLFELKNSERFNLAGFRLELLKTRYSNEFIEDKYMEEQNDRLMILHLRREYLGDRQYSIVMKFIKNKDKNLLIFIELVNEIVYDNNGNEYFI